MTTTSTMEAWLAELEKEVDPAPILINSCDQYNHCERMETTFAELSATLGEQHFPYSYFSESNTSSPDEWNLDNIFLDQYTPPLETSNTNENNNICYDIDREENVQESQRNNGDKQVINRKKQETRGGAKRKRQPNQVQDHIIAERKRRELLGQQFISLSGLVPGLKKMDKTTVLGETIKYMKQLQENVKNLEETVAKRAVESVVVIKKSQLIVNDDSGDDTDNSSSTMDNNCTSGCSGAGGGSSRELDNVNDLLPEIEVKISSKKLLLRIYCENQKGIMTKLFRELEIHDFRITNCSVVPFESLTLDITIVAEMERGFNVNVKDFVKNVRSCLRL